jgi:hypothetical protein
MLEKGDKLQGKHTAQYRWLVSDSPNKVSMELVKFSSRVEVVHVSARQGCPYCP